MLKNFIEAVCNKCINIESKEFQSIGKQVIPSNTKFTKIRQYNPKNKKNLVQAGFTGFMYGFYLY